MKKDTISFLEHADEALSDARKVLSIGVARQAARLAYYAQFHAAQVLIFERTDQNAKTHKGVRVLFHKLANEDANIPGDLVGELTSAFHFKVSADYETATRAMVSDESAGDAIKTAERFLSAVRKSLEAKLI